MRKEANERRRRAVWILYKLYCQDLNNEELNVFINWLFINYKTLKKLRTISRY